MLGVPTIPLHATASAVSENLVIATGLVSDDIEALFVLDGLSGDLQCTAYSPAARQFNVLFRRNVIADLQLDVTKKPEFLMVTGELASVRRSQPIGQCLVYVVEANSGKFAAYTVPWRRDLFVSGRPQQGELLLLQAGNVRTAAVRE